MQLQNPANFTFELNLANFRQRLFEILPGTLSWTTIIGLAVLSFILPFWVAIFVIAYDVYILIRAVYISIHLVYAYRRLRKMEGIDWLAHCRGVTTNPKQYYRQIISGLNQIKNSRLPSHKRTRWQLKQLKKHLAETISLRVKIFPWQQVHHAIIIPTYNEPLKVLRTSLDSLVNTDFPSTNLHVVVGFEERAGDISKKRARALQQQYRRHFATFIIAYHPDNLPGEKRVKSANATWAMRKLEAELTGKKIPVDNVLVSNFDSDTVIMPTYFSYLTFAFITHPDRYRVSYQPIPMYDNNLWDAPAFSRVIATGSTFWQMIESTRPERMVTFSSHSMTLRALKDVGYWQTDIVSEDSRIFWQCLIRYDGHYRTHPLYTSVSMDAALASSWWQTFKSQYKQKRRWAWGIENFPFIAEGFWRNKKISRRIKFIYLWRTLEGHYSWTTTAIIIAGLGWLPIFFGGPDFHTTVLSYSLPYVARTIMTITMAGLIISTALSLLLLPPKPARYSKWRYLPMSIQWILVPFIATILSAFPALDAETRLLLGRDLGFYVTQKTRKS